MALVYRELLSELRRLAVEVRLVTSWHNKLGSAMDAQARDTGRTAEHIAGLKVDSATVAETREVARIMQGLSTATLSFRGAADGAHRAASAAEQETVATHGGINEAVSRSPVEMANRTWYRQE